MNTPAIEEVRARRPSGKLHTKRHRSPEFRFWKSVSKEYECWEWKGSYGRGGYGKIAIMRSDESWTSESTHRFSYFLHNPDDDRSLQVCHTCDNRKCVNPDHLWLGTIGDNIRDMHAKGRNFGQQKTHCSQGHEYTDENTIKRSISKRGCKECNRIRARANYLKKMQAKQLLS